MRVEREAFLALTVSIAAGAACGPGAREPQVAVIEIPPQPAIALDAGGPVVEPAPKSKKPPAPAAEDDDDDDPMVAPTAEVDDDDDDSGGCGFVNPANVTRPKAACNEAVGTPGACAIMQRCATGDQPFSRQRCEDYKKFFKPKVAERAVACMIKLSRTAVCDACNAYRCGDEALKTSCPDTSAEPSCNQIVGKCKSVTKTDCMLYLSGMNAVGRAKMVTCMSTPSSCRFGLYSCAEGL